MRDHAHFDELAAGSALGALDPGDDREFRAHLAGCALCQETLADYAEVTAGLALTGSADDGTGPSPQLRARILAAAAAPPTDPPSPLRAVGGRRRPRPRVIAAGIAAVVVLIAGVVTALNLTRAPAPAQVTSCAGVPGCREVLLTAAGARDPAARVVVIGRTAWLVPAGLRPDDSARQTYVLWQLRASRTPVAVGAFDVRRGRTAGVRVGQLKVPYRGTTAFAVSLESGRAIPALPSPPVADGQVPAS
jgi:hypothetical protein